MWHIWENLKQRDHLEDQDQAIRGRIILSCNVMGREGLNCISLSQAMGRQWALVKIVMYLQFPYSAGGLLDRWLPEKDPDSYSWLVN